MTSAKDWAIAMQVGDEMDYRRRHSVADDEPTILVQRIAGHAVLCGGAIEQFSEAMPIFIPTTPAEDGLCPIDVLYGAYKPASRSIELFVNRIERDAIEYGAEPHELRTIVRLHEQAHAIVHLGTRCDDIPKCLSGYDKMGLTDWPKFIGERTTWFNTCPTDVHEFLAQALTYAAIYAMSSPRESEKLLKVFDALEAKQPSHYKLSALVKQHARLADWRLVLDTARDSDVVYGEKQDFTLRAGLEALVCKSGEGAAPPQLPSA
jgi:hypothetical protein